MTYTIRLTPAELRQKADTIEQNANIVKKDVNDVKGMVSKIRSSFLGQTAATFFKKFDTACQDMDQWDKVVRSFALELRDAANKLEAADRAGAA
jgi:WXG100 family type VII secretion target